MPKKLSQRTFSNVLLTKRHHFAHMGLWIAVSVALVVTVNTLLYLLMEEHFAGVNSLSNALHEEYIAFRTHFIAAILVETALFAVGIVALAMFTDHRITGPYVRLRMVFDAVRDGDMSQRLKFRDYDRLEDLAESFNAMMDNLERNAPSQTDPKRESDA